MTTLKKPRAYLAAALLCVSSVMFAASAQESESNLDIDVFRGQVVVVDFWASWCVPCRRSFPWLNSMHEKYADEGLVIVGVNVDKERAEASGFLQEFPARFRIRYDPEGTLAEQYGVQGMPSSFVIGRDGELRTKHLGFKVRKQQEYEAAIVAALEENAG